MRLALISDVHANFEALEAVLAAIDGLNVDGIVHLGDAVGYGADPNAVCELLARRVRISLMGNHDAAVLERLPLAWFSLPARRAAEWTQRRLSGRNAAWLEGSPATWRYKDVLFSHGSPVVPEAFEYVFHSDTAAEIFTLMHEQGLQTVFVGHAHQCLAFADDGRPPIRVDGVETTTLELGGRRWVINVGSVGQPRDGEPRAFFGIVDFQNGVYEARRVTYNLEAAAEKIRAAGLPSILADRLRLGK